MRMESDAVLDKAARLRTESKPFALVTVVRAVSPTSAKPGAKALVEADGVIQGWVGGGCAEALQCMKCGESSVIDIDLNDEVLGAGMPCGGSMRVYVEPVLPRPALWLMGHGRAAECIYQMADLMGLKVIVNDPIISWEKYPAQLYPSNSKR